MNIKPILLKINKLPYMVWDAETPHGFFFGRGHLSRAFFYSLPKQKRKWKRKIPESGTACALQT